MRGVATFWTVASGVARRNLTLVVRAPAILLPSILFPLFFLIAFAGGLSRMSQVPGFDFPSGYTAFQFAFVVVQSSAMGGVFTGFQMARDFESGFIRRLMLAAPSRLGVLWGYALTGLGRSVITVGVLWAVALLAGMDVDGTPQDIVGLVGLGFLVNLAGTGWAAGLALRFRSMQAGPAMQTPVFLAIFLAPVYVPLSLLEGWIHAIASLNPITAVLEANRGLISGTDAHVALAYGAASGVVLLTAIWAVRGLRSAEQAT